MFGKLAETILAAIHMTLHGWYTAENTQDTLNYTVYPTPTALNVYIKYTEYTLAEKINIRIKMDVHN